MKSWFTGLSLIWQLIAVFVALVGAYLVWGFIDDIFSKSDEVQAEISENQTEAAIESGIDTVTTINNQHTKEIVRTETVRVIQQEVNNAEDFHSAHTAGANGLCVNFSVCAEDQLQPAGP